MEDAQLNGDDALGWLVDCVANSTEIIHIDGYHLSLSACKRVKAELIAERNAAEDARSRSDALFKRCRDFIEGVDHWDATECALLLSDLDKVL